MKNLFDQSQSNDSQEHDFIADLNGLIPASVPTDFYDTLDSVDSHLVLEAKKAIETWFPSDCIHELFEDQVARMPQAVAVIHADQSLTYRELNARANQLARHLRTLGVKPDSRVAICAERSMEMVIGLLGVLKAGGAYVPLDPNYPAQRLQYMLADSKPMVLLSQDQLHQSIGDLHGIPVVDLAQTLDSYSAENLHSGEFKLIPDHLAYVIYTSGSTGTPKGTAVHQKGVVNLLHWFIEQFTLQNSDKVILFSSFSFDLTQKNILSVLIVGGELHIPSAGYDPKAAASYIEKHGVTFVNCAPSAFYPLLEHAHTEGFSSLRQVFLGGEPINSALLHEIFSTHPACPIVHNTYGPTEASDVVSFYSWNPKEANVNIPIGRSIYNTQLYILTESLYPAAVEAVGEIYIAGVGLARGYLNRPELTADKFIPNPYSHEAGARMYKSGDLARYLSDGNIEYLGRIDNQVKLRGLRIELGEIEAALAQVPGVRDSVVLAREDVPGDKRLVAYIVRHAEAQESTVAPGALRGALLHKLPEYMVPAAFVQMENLPLTVNGKLDRKALPLPQKEAYATRVYEAPQGGIETALAATWSEVLRIDRIGRYDNFFELGGNSLMIVTLIERMQLQGLQADIRAIYSAPTLSELAAVMRTSVQAIVVPPNLIPSGCTDITPEMVTLAALVPAEIEVLVNSVPGGAANIQDIYPLVPLQEGILFHHLMAAEGDTYLISSLFSFATRELLDRYMAAMQAVVDRHDILRTSVHWDHLSEPVQVVWRQAPLHIMEVSLECTADAAEQLLQRFNPRHYRIDIRQAPMLQFHVAWDGARSRWLMHMLHHHFIGDHRTVDTMREEVQAYLLNHEEQLPKAAPFRNFVAEARIGMGLQEHEAFFRQMLGDVDEPTAPYGLMDVQGDGRGILQSHLKVDIGLAVRFRERARRLGVSAATLCHQAWGHVLSRLTGCEDVVFGTVFFGGIQAGHGSGRALGLFINTLPIKIHVGAQGLEQSVRATHSLLAGLMHHEHAPLALAQRCSSVANSVPLFTSLFNYRHSANPQSSSPEAVQAWDGIKWLGGEERTNYPVGMTVDDLGEGFVLTAKTHPSIAPMDVCELMRTALEGLAQVLESDFPKAASSLDILPPTERNLLLKTWSAHPIPHVDQACIHSLFEVQAEQFPNRTAAICQDSSLSYRELNAKANRLAHYLLKLDIGTEARVGLFMERSLDMLVGILGTLKAGGCYVPIDPKYPIERMLVILAEAGATVLVTQSRFAAVLPELNGIKVIVIDDEQGYPESLSAANPVDVVQPTNLMYILYTSGSTGNPKGVAVTHGNYFDYLQRFLNKIDVPQGLSYAIVSTFAADLGTSMVYGALCTGGCLHIIPYEMAVDPDGMCKYLSHHPVDVLKMVPNHVEAWMGSVDANLVLPRRLLVLAGEACRWDTIAKIRQSRPDLRIQNHYGPTETSVAILFHEVEVGMPIPPFGTVPIGKPLGEAAAYILDANMRPVPRGVPGELYVGGSCVTRGYLGRPDLTAERFLPDPFGAHAGMRLYYTGDRVRYLADGSIEFLERVDFQVKIRGFRIELGEIETLLGTLPAVRESAVIVREDVPNNKSIVAYVVLNQESGDSNAIDGLRDHLRKRLPDYMVPSAFVELEQLPLNLNGKLDRKALPKPERSRASGQSVAPRNEVEAAIASAWCEVLGIEAIGIDDNFFDLGGDSLKAIRAVRAIGRGCGVVDMFTYSTARQLAERLSQERSGGMLVRLSKPVTKESAVVSIVCVPNGGGSSVMYKPLADALPVGYSLFGVELPGHDFSRAHEGLAMFDDIAQRCVEEIKKEITGPIVLYGHCVGGAMVVEIARLLEEGGSSVVGVVVGGTFPFPRLPGKVLGFFNKLLTHKRLTSNRLERDQLIALGGATGLTEDEQLFIVANMRHDSKEAEEYYTRRYAENPIEKLQAPIRCIVGENDRTTKFYPDLIKEWDNFSSSVSLTVLSKAGHFFHQHQAKDLAQVITGFVDSTVALPEQGEKIPFLVPQRVAAKNDDKTPKPSLSLFLKVVIGQFISIIGTGLTDFALGIWVYQQTNSVAALGFVTAMALGASIVVLPIAGAVADRFDRRKVMMISDGIAGIRTLALALLLWFNLLEIWHCFVIMSIGSAANMFQRPAYMAAVAQIVPKRYLGQANGIVQIGGAVSTIFAPLLGGLLLSKIDLHGIVLVDFSSFLFAIAIMLFVRFPNTLPERQEEPMRKAIVGGWKYIIRRKSLVALVCFYFVFNFMEGMALLLVTPLVLSVGTSSLLGTAFSFAGIGALLGSVIMSIWGGTRRRANGMLFSGVFIGLGMIAVGLGLSPAFLVGGMFCYGFSSLMVNSHWQTMMQTKVGLELQGRVIATNQMMANLTVPLGTLAAAPLLDKLVRPFTAGLEVSSGPVAAFIKNTAGNGMGLALMLLGVLLIIWSFVGLWYRPLRYMEDALPDAVPDAVIDKDKDKLQAHADALLQASGR